MTVCVFILAFGLLWEVQWPVQCTLTRDSDQIDQSNLSNRRPEEVKWEPQIRFENGEKKAPIAPTRLER